jgi:hypothetical protein
MFDRLQEAAERFPARGALRTLAHVHYLRIKGSPAAALEQLSTVLASTSPEKGVRFAWTGATHLMLLNALGRHAEAVSTGRHYLTASLERGLELGDCALMVRPLAEALALSGNAEEAIELAEALIARFEGAGDSGLGLGSCYETRARIALATRDAEAFDRWTERCRSEYQRAHNPALRAKLARLLREGQLAHVAGPLTSTEPAREEEDASERVGEDGTVLSRMAECVDARERARCALTLLMEETGAGEGHLYGWLSGRLTHLVSVPELAPPLGLDEMIQRCIEAELGACDTTSPGGNDRPAPIEETPAPESHPLQPALLCAQRDGEPLVAAAAALGGQADPALKPSAKLLSTLAQSLLEHDDVDALARFV